MMQFIISYGHPRLDGTPVYNPQDYAFDFEIASSIDLAKYLGSQGTTSITIGTLQIEVDVESGRALYVWGYHPHTSWLHGRVSPPKGRTGCLKVAAPAGLEPGISIDVKKGGIWSTVFDKGSGWVGVGDSTTSEFAECVEFASHTIAAVHQGKLKALWIRPIFTKH